MGTEVAQHPVTWSLSPHLEAQHPPRSRGATGAEGLAQPQLGALGAGGVSEELASPFPQPGDTPTCSVCPEGRLPQTVRTPRVPGNQPADAPVHPSDARDCLLNPPGQ